MATHVKACILILSKKKPLQNAMPSLCLLALNIVPIPQHVELGDLEFGISIERLFNC